ncbi:hypothetical protein WJX81_003251 [Elliptochloris bilobata]|uniref:Uncharacterized protein n=1 Tax=Elliptochloris bilobata TaxID=381761 RepID=A0AAW1RPF7_9CHLO
MTPTPLGLFKRQTDPHSTFATACAKRRAHSLVLSGDKTISSVHTGGVTWLDLDCVEERYLLAGAADGSVAAYDIQVPVAVDASGAAQHDAVFKVDRGRLGHAFTVSSVVWYAIDTGLFVSGSFDKTVKVWDTNALRPACEFVLSERVHAVAMSHCATAHCLVAAGAEDPHVRLCDPASGGFTHVLTGHRGAVWAAAWSRTSEWHLATGASDGQVRMWDIRTSGCVRVFDQHNTSAARPQRRPHRRAGVAGEQHDAHVTAHDGSVTAVLQTPDGHSWLTAGNDSRVRLWDARRCRNLLVNYADTYNRARKARQLAACVAAGLLFHSSGSVVQVLDLYTGELRRLLRGHMDTISGLCYHPGLHELYSGAADCQIIVWAPERATPPEEAPHAAAAPGVTAPPDQDAWSD